MQNSEAQRDCLERATRYGAHEHAIWETAMEAGNVQSGCLFGVYMAVAQIDGHRAHAERRECFFQRPYVPVDVAVPRERDAWSRSGFAGEAIRRTTHRADSDRCDRGESFRLTRAR